MARNWTPHRLLGLGTEYTPASIVSSSIFNGGHQSKERICVFLSPTPSCTSVNSEKYRLKDPFTTAIRSHFPPCCSSYNARTRPDVRTARLHLRRVANPGGENASRATKLEDCSAAMVKSSRDWGAIIGHSSFVKVFVRKRVVVHSCGEVEVKVEWSSRDGDSSPGTDVVPADGCGSCPEGDCDRVRCSCCEIG